MNGIYEADYRDFNRETYARGAKHLVKPMRPLKAADWGLGADAQGAVEHG